ncbi:dTDP-4-dehydrorhamnose 3,5-epimerase [Candidatus Methanophagaceae archaeon]|nr:dTDP-4-dehydrorhamnose 3,5-epimerase [Methanophagales archaeon]
MLKELEVKPLRRFADERGFFTELMRSDWADIFDQKIVQTNFSISYPGMVRAWHRHLRGQVDCFVVLRGALKICAYDDETEELDEVVSAGDNLQVVRMPGHYWHGFKVVGDERAYLVYFVNRLYEYENPDEERRPWNDPTVVPKLINGSTNDERCDKPWNWLELPYK